MAGSAAVSDWGDGADSSDFRARAFGDADSLATAGDGAAGSFDLAAEIGACDLILGRPATSGKAAAGTIAGELALVGDCACISDGGRAAGTIAVDARALPLLAAEDGKASATVVGAEVLEIGYRLAGSVANAGAVGIAIVEALPLSRDARAGGSSAGTTEAAGEGGAMRGAEDTE
jgi:hypothetical protein